MSHINKRRNYVSLIQIVDGMTVAIHGFTDVDYLNYDAARGEVVLTEVIINGVVLKLLVCGPELASEVIDQLLEDDFQTARSYHEIYKEAEVLSRTEPCSIKYCYLQLLRDRTDRG